MKRTDLKAALEDLLLESEEDWRLRGEAADIYRELVSRFSHQGFADEELRRRIEEADEIIWELREALRANWKGESEFPELLWPYFVAGSPSIDREPEGCVGPSPVDRDRADQAVSRYLARPWMQSEVLDWFLLRSLFFDDAARFAESIRDGTILGRHPLFAILRTGDQWELRRLLLTGEEGQRFWSILAKSMVSSFAAFTLRWLTLPALAAWAIYIKNVAMGASAIGLYVIYVAWRIFRLPSKMRERRERRHAWDKVQIVMNHFTDLEETSRRSVLHPSDLRRRIDLAISDGVAIDPLILAIIDRAIERDPYVLNRDGRSGCALAEEAP